MTTSWTEQHAQRQIRPAADWKPGGGEYEDIRFELSEGIA
jgi:hypothetical protein